jgi:acetyl/propionyl-CoA carboxylase alpha subunit
MDSHLYPDYLVPPNYDSLLGKLIVWGEDRNQVGANENQRERVVRCGSSRHLRGYEPPLMLRHAVINVCTALQCGYVAVRAVGAE